MSSVYDGSTIYNTGIVQYWEIFRVSYRAVMHYFSVVNNTTGVLPQCEGGLYSGLAGNHSICCCERIFREAPDTSKYKRYILMLLTAMLGGFF